jgi:hypothetical protein
MLHIFCGTDRREAVGFHVFTESVLRRASIPVAFVPIPMIQFFGTNQFTLSRFLVPYFMGYKGRAVFADAADMICLADVAELKEMLDSMDGAVGVVKHEYKTKNPVKYIDTEMESPNLDYPRKNWSSLMLINCEHESWRFLTPDVFEKTKMLDFLKLNFISPEDIVEIDRKWNVLVDEGQDTSGAKILHWTAGIPGFEYYKDAPEAHLWRLECSQAMYPYVMP